MNVQVIGLLFRQDAPLITGYFPCPVADFPSYLVQYDVANVVKQIQFEEIEAYIEEMRLGSAGGTVLSGAVELNEAGLIADVIFFYQ